MPTQAAPQKKKLPPAARWLIGYAVLLLACAGLVYFWRVIFLLPAAFPAFAFTLGVMGIASLVYGGVFLICRVKGPGVYLKAVLAIVLVGLLFCFATAPLQVPDEQGHFLRAWSVSAGRFTYDYEESYPNDVNLLLQYFSGAMNHEMTYQNREMAPAAMAGYRAAVQAGTPAAKEASSPIMFMLLPYLPGAAFMAVARVLGFTALGQLYACRLANLLVYALLCLFALKNCEKYRGLFIAFMLLPLSLFMAASCSYDSIMLALCFYLVSFVCKSRMGARDIVLFCLALCFAAYIKPINILLAGLLLLVPKAGWQPRHKRLLVAALAAVGALVLWWGLGKIDAGPLRQNWPDELPRGSGEAADPDGQMAFILRNPLRFVAVALQSLLEADLFLFDLGRLGSMDLSLPVVGGASLLVLCFGAVMSMRKNENVKPALAAGLGALALVYAAGVLAGLYVTDTDLFSIRITGPQPRYFLPAFLMLFMLAAMLLGRGVKPALNADAIAQKRTETLTLWVAVGLGIFCAVLLFQSYFIGQWLPKGEGGWKLVNLFGWVQR